MAAPSTFKEAEKYVNNPELFPMLTQRLIEMAFNEKGAPAIRAIEILLEMPREKVADDLDEMTTETLTELLNDIEIAYSKAKQIEF